ncbi:endonuclease domain-containing protein [Qipengyuania qiaonensis]|uniref:Endonuclease domain-containing protein n=1 Tax=Qipengyuania qiaonensis TaxID=2867240 RepID=A0ABS7J4B4_9SPHN|nr:endonuclease domain-containing protein [Qipengyuania qiaonensis]MBX7481126.1 endonuclease domain-containing protein [Qipengyuania qiaonensis]
MITGPRDTIKRARKLRSEMSVPERLLWRHLRERPGGFKFRRQHPAGVYVLDFYCAAIRLAIEIDGWAHDSAERISRDRAKSEFLRSQGVATTRIPAKLVLEDVEVVIVRLLEICDGRMADFRSRQTCPSTTSWSPSPYRGG